MKITIRIPTETYAYYEVEFGSAEEYRTEYPKFVKTMTEVRSAVNKQKDPFEAQKRMNRQ